MNIAERRNMTADVRRRRDALTSFAAGRCKSLSMGETFAEPCRPEGTEFVPIVCMLPETPSAGVHRFNLRGRNSFALADGEK